MLCFNQAHIQVRRVAGLVIETAPVEANDDISILFLRLDVEQTILLADSHLVVHLLQRIATSSTVAHYFPAS